jgi:histone-lysine N-methyltransferase SETDB1
MAEVVEYLCQVAVEELTVDQFTFDDAVSLSTNPAVSNEKPPVYIEDLSKGEEAKPISCVNEIDNEQPPNVKYISSRLTEGVDINVDPTFLVCCDCTDDCQDKESCACFQLTREAAEAVGIDCDTDVGYTFRRIQNARRTAIYECNSRCKCSARCANRVVQNGIQIRLQVFKTQQKGWGVRCIDDVPKGSFICCYAGQLLTEEDANKEGHRRGDEYIAELDHIEVVEKMKEGYESDVSDCSSSLMSSVSSDEEAMPSLGAQKATSINSNVDKKEDDDNMLALGHLAAPFWCRVALNISDNDVEKAAEWIKENSADLPAGDSPSEITSHTDSSPAESLLGASSIAMTGIWSMGNNSDSIEFPAANNNESCELLSATGQSTDYLSGYQIALKSTSSHQSCSVKSDSRSREIDTGTPAPASTTRSLFGDLGCYAVDAKSIGNVGRYLNHSCCPNLFVQNVFVDTHDLRFPWVAFFSKFTIKAMTELTWDYNYEVGSVPDRELNCYCGTLQCRGRLL